MSINNDGKTKDRKIKHSYEINEELDKINYTPNEGQNETNTDSSYSTEDFKEKIKRRSVYYVSNSFIY